MLNEPSATSLSFPLSGVDSKSDVVQLSGGNLPSWKELEIMASAEGIKTGSLWRRLKRAACPELREKDRDASRRNWTKHREKYSKKKKAAWNALPESEKKKEFERFKARYPNYENSQQRKSGKVAYNREWRAKNPEKRKLQHARYYLRNKAEAYEKSANRRAKIRNSIGDFPPKEIILKWKSEKHFTCYYCQGRFKTDGNLNIDHIVPLIKGGKHSVENLCRACEHCNKSKRAKSLADFSARDCDQKLLNLT